MDHIGKSESKQAMELDCEIKIGNYNWLQLLNFQLAVLQQF